MRASAVVFVCYVGFAAPVAGQVMYGSTASNGRVGTVDQTNGDFTLLGDPTATGALSGLTFDTTGRLFGSVPADSSCCSSLIEINPINGSLIATIGDIETAPASGVRIVDLAAQPSTGTLFGIDKNGVLYTIDKTTAVATLVGDTGLSKGGIAFAPNGTLYLANTDSELAQLDPATGAPIGSVLNTGECIDGLGVRPTDGQLFATECDGNSIFRIDPVSGNATFIGSPEDDTADLAFQIVARSSAPAISNAGLALTAMLLLAFAARRIAGGSIGRSS